MIPLSPLSFVQCGQVKFQPKKKGSDKGIPKYSGRRYSACVCVGEGGKGRQAWHELNLCNFFNLITFTIFNKA